MNTRSRNTRPGLKVQTSIKAGGVSAQHNERLLAGQPSVLSRRSGLKVRTSVKAGA